MQLSYQIDGEDRLVAWGGSWDDFARENAAPELCELRKPRSLWSFIDGQSSTHLYRLLVEKVRAERATFDIPFRCDAPGRRRFMTLTLSPGPNDRIDFVCRVDHCEDREPMIVLDSECPRTDAVITMCSFCKRVACEDDWLEIEDALARMRIFHHKDPPRISHDACPDCYQVIMDQLRAHSKKSSASN
jgi:hypothetical protein